MFALPALTSLRLHSRDLTKLVCGVGNLQSLRELELATPEMQLPPSISLLTGLTRLVLAANMEHGEYSLPEEVGELCLLEVLDCKKCLDLEKFPHTLSRLTALRELLVALVDEGLPCSLSSLTRLERLELGGLAQDEPQGVASLGRLHTLRLYNPYEDRTFVDPWDLRWLADVAPNLTALTELKLAWWSGSQLPAGLRHLPALRVLDLSDMDDVEDLPGSLSELTDLQCLLPKTV